MFIKNISNETFYLNDIGFELIVNEVLNLDDIDSDDLSSSQDLIDGIDLGLLVYLDDDSITELTPEESQELQESQNKGVDLSDYAKIGDSYTKSENDVKLLGKSDNGHGHDDRYYTKSEDNLLLGQKSNSNHTHTPVDLSAYLTAIQIQALIDASPTGNGDNTMVDSVYKLPAFLVEYDRLTYGNKNLSGSSKFFNQLHLPYYVNQETTNRQTLIDVTGEGLLTGIMLPTLEINHDSGRSVTVFVTIDGVETSETFTYSNTNNEQYRIFIGSANSSDRSDVKSVGELVLESGKDYNSDSLYSDKKFSLGIANKRGYANIPHPSSFLGELAKPKMQFRTDLKIEYQLSQSDMFEDSNYRNRAVAFILYGDF